MKPVSKKEIIRLARLIEAKTGKKVVFKESEEMGIISLLKQYKEPFKIWTDVGNYLGFCDSEGNLIFNVNDLDVNDLDEEDTLEEDVTMTVDQVLKDMDSVEKLKNKNIDIKITDDKNKSGSSSTSSVVTI